MSKTEDLAWAPHPSPSGVCMCACEHMSTYVHSCGGDSVMHTGDCKSQGLSIHAPCKARGTGCRAAKFH